MKFVYKLCKRSSEEFRLEGKKGLFLDGKDIEIGVVDAT
jgi:hypothetical protein